MWSVIATYLKAIILHCSSGEGSRWFKGTSLLILLGVCWLLLFIVFVFILAEGLKASTVSLENPLDGDTSRGVWLPAAIVVLCSETIRFEVLSSVSTWCIQSGVTVTSPNASVEVHLRRSSMAAGYKKKKRKWKNINNQN